MRLNASLDSLRPGATSTVPGRALLSAPRAAHFGARRAPRASVTIACAASSSSSSSTPASSISGRSLQTRVSLSSSSLLTRPGARFSRSGALQTRAFFGKMFKQDPSENTRKKYQDRVDAINALEPSLQALSDEQLRAKTDEFKGRVKRGESLDALLPEAFAVRLWGAAASDAARRAAAACGGGAV